MNKNKILETWLKWLRNGEWYNVTDDIERLLLEPERDVCWCGVPLAKPEQEPVALKMVYGEVCCQSKHDDQSFGMWCPITEEDFPNGTPFYTTPPRKPWVGLTDGEMESLVTQAREVPVEIPCDSFTTRLLKLAAQFFKEKNT